MFKFVLGEKITYMKQKYLILIAFLASFCAEAQSIPNHCASPLYLDILKTEDPGLSNRLGSLEQQTQAYINSHQSFSGSVIVIPVVFHIVYNTPSQNLPDGVIHEQMDILNADYAKINSDTSNIPAVWKSIATDMHIQFCLAAYDTLGNPTTGIIHTSTANTTFANSPSDHKINFTSQGGANAWNRNHYLNIWVCNLGSGILGFTQLPGVGTAAKDGCVINCMAVGKTGATAPYNLGRTVTHEVGHWLNLNHTWGDDYGYCYGTDYVADTPNEGNANYSSYPAYTVKTDSCSASSPGFMWQNYMDYTDDAGMCFFTAGQAQRMQATLHGPRDSILTSPALGPAAIKELNLNSAISIFPSPSSGTIYLRLNGLFGNIAIRVMDLAGNQIFESFSEKPEALTSFDFSSLRAGVYFLDIAIENRHLIRKMVLLH
jgi:hypothetical protein